ncbi:gluconokinase [Nitrospira sp.]|nr:gluconokinase [Nitrospira sp.]
MPRIRHIAPLPPTAPQIVVLMGVSGSGKTTIGQRLARELGWHFCDGDDLHSRSNITKMSLGTPLTDRDRAGWLEKMRERLNQWMREGVHVVLAASLLRAMYRQRVLGPWRSHVLLVYLGTAPVVLAQRLAQRSGHFMKQGMLASQLAILEIPDDAMVVDATDPPESIVQKITREILG